MKTPQSQLTRRLTKPRVSKGNDSSDFFDGLVKELRQTANVKSVSISVEMGKQLCHASMETGRSIAGSEGVGRKATLQYIRPQAAE